MVMPNGRFYTAFNSMFCEVVASEKKVIAQLLKSQLLFCI